MQEDGIPKCKEQDELDKYLADQLKQIQLLEELEGVSNKRSLEKIEEILVGTFATAMHSIIAKKVYNGEYNDMI